MHHIWEFLQDKHLVPDFIVSSTAKRARSTAKAVAKAARYEGDIILNQALYAAPPTSYMKSYVTCQTNMPEC